jgi:hypothetical protein
VPGFWIQDDFVNIVANSDYIAANCFLAVTLDRATD